MTDPLLAFLDAWQAVRLAPVGAVRLRVGPGYQHRRRARGYHELYCCDAGELELTLGGVGMVLRSGDGLVVPPSEHFREVSAIGADLVIIGFRQSAGGGPDPIGIIGLPRVVAAQRADERRRFARRLTRLIPYGEGPSASALIEATGCCTR